MDKGIVLVAGETESGEGSTAEAGAGAFLWEGFARSRDA